MSLSFESIILSRPFKFIIGKNEVPIIVHEQAFAELSPALCALMKGKMSESLAGETSWKDVDQETFLRFAQFAYIGDYPVPKVYVRKSDGGQEAVAQQTSGPAAANLDDDIWGWTTSKKKYKNRFKSRSDVFKSLTYSLLRPTSIFEPSEDLPVSDGPDDKNISEVLLIHASLYVLAEKWVIESLKRLTLFKLHKTLKLLQLDEPKLPHLIKLVQYAYSEENIPDLNNGIDDLRALICQYVAANADFLLKQSAFIAILEEGGVFVRDSWKFLVPIHPAD